MSEKFEDIKMSGFADTPPKMVTGEAPAIRELTIRLSKVPPQEWTDAFNAAWRTVQYSDKRPAEVRAGFLRITCVPNRFDDDHKRTLERVIAEINQSYRTSRAAEESARIKAEADKATKDVEEAAAYEKLKKDVTF